MRSEGCDSALSPRGTYRTCSVREGSRVTVQRKEDKTSESRWGRHGGSAATQPSCRRNVHDTLMAHEATTVPNAPGVMTPIGSSTTSLPLQIQRAPSRLKPGERLPMLDYKVEARVSSDGSLTLEDLPFRAGDGVVPGASLPHIFRRYCPPARNRASVIWPSEQHFTVSINSSKMFSPDSATRWSLCSAPGALSLLRS
jgi:hypothetical protein